MSIITEALRKAQKNRFKEDRGQTYLSKSTAVPDLSSDIISYGRNEEAPNKKTAKKIFLLLFFAVVFFVISLITILRVVNHGAGQLAKIGEPFINEDTDKVSDKSGNTYFPEQKNETKQQTPKNLLSSEALPVLNGIMFTSVYPTAIVNETIVSPGDTVAGYKVINISPDSVKLSKDSVEYILKLQ